MSPYIGLVLGRYLLLPCSHPFHMRSATSWVPLLMYDFMKGCDSWSMERYYLITFYKIFLNLPFPARLISF